MFSIPATIVALSGHNIMIAEAFANMTPKTAKVESKHRFRNMKKSIVAKGERTIAKVEKKMKAITHSKVHAEIKKRHTTTTVELLDTKMQLTDTNAKLNAEKGLRAESERKQLEAEEKVEALTREAQNAREEVVAAEAARISAEQHMTQIGGELLAAKQDFNSIIEDVQVAEKRWTFERGANEEYREDAENKITELKQKVANSEKQRAALAVEQDELKAQCDTTQEALEDMRQELAAPEEKCAGICSDKQRLSQKYTTAEEKIQTLSTKNDDLKKRKEELKSKNEGLQEENDELKGDLFVQKSKVLNLEAQSALQGNAKCARAGHEQKQRADQLQIELQNQQGKTAQLISTLKKILPAAIPLPDDATLENLAAMVIKHHEYLAEKVQVAEAKFQDLNSHWKIEDEKMHTLAADARTKLFDAGIITQGAAALEQRVKIAEQHASKLPKLQADHDKHFNAAKQLCAELKTKKESVEKFGKMITTQNVQISQLKKELAEFKDKEGGDDSEAMKKLKGELEMAKYELDMAQIEVRQAKKAAAGRPA